MVSRVQYLNHIMASRNGKQAVGSLLYREPESLEETAMIVFCMKCNSKSTRHMDPAPVYEIATGQYIARRAPCDACPAPSTSKGRGRAREIMIPCDRTVTYIRWNWLGKDINREDARWAHKR